MCDLRMHLNSLTNTADQAQQRGADLGSFSCIEFADRTNATNAKNGAYICHKNGYGYAGNTSLNFFQAFRITLDLHLLNITFQLIDLGIGFVCILLIGVFIAVISRSEPAKAKIALEHEQACIGRNPSPG